MTLYLHEMKMNRKSLLIWTGCVGLMCFGCILLYGSLEESVSEMAEMFSDLGAMSVALGLDKMSLATMRGYYATEIAMMHNLGGAMFAAILGTTLLSKEENGHTSEFLNTFPVNRGSIVGQKALALLSNIIVLNVVCLGLYMAAFWLMREEMDVSELILFQSVSAWMQIEVGAVCFLLSAFTKRNSMGAGLGIALLLFAADMMCRIIPAIESLKYITPFYYANAADLFTAGKANGVMLAIGAAVAGISFAGAWAWYRRKDLAA